MKNVQKQDRAGKLLSLAEAAAVCGVPESWLDNQCKLGRAPCIRITADTALFSEPAIIEFVNKMASSKKASNQSSFGCHPEINGYCSVAKAASSVGISKQAVYRLIQEGKLPALKVGRAIRIRWADLQDFITNNTSVSQ